MDKLARVQHLYYIESYSTMIAVTEDHQIIVAWPDGTWMTTSERMEYLQTKKGFGRVSKSELEHQRNAFAELEATAKEMLSSRA